MIELARLMTCQYVMRVFIEVVCGRDLSGEVYVWMGVPFGSVNVLSVLVCRW